MPSAERARFRPGDLSLAIGVLVGIVSALLPLMRVISPSWWVLGVLVVAGAILAAGVLARRSRVPALAVSLIESLVWVLAMTLIFARDTALLWIIPTPATLSAVPVMYETAVQEITLGSAPLAATDSVTILIVGAAGLLAIIFDHVVLTARLPLVAAIGLVSVSLIPSIAVPGDFETTPFLLLSATILFLVRTETRSRREPMPTSSAQRSPLGATSTSATAIGIAAIALVVAVVATPLLPQPSSRAGASIGGTASINPTLQLGENLRRPRDVEVLTLRSTASSVPYLRVVTLSTFTGRVWEPDTGDTFPIGTGQGFGTVIPDSEIAVSQNTTHVQIKNLSTRWLPIPFPAVAVNGLDDQWAVMPENRTIVGTTTTATGLDYEVLTEVPRPTLEQIRARPAGGPNLDASTRELPNDVPADIAATAKRVTAGAKTDYDALLALQTWFRGSEFTYSLDAPVEDGFDGTGIRAVDQFLSEKKGYCIHFASAFAIMARTLGMPSRIVVGYLPGTNTSDTVDNQTVYSVQSSQLHSWPEVYFQGIGWVPFEPTKSLGTPTSFSPASVSPTDTTDRTTATTAPSDASTPSPTASVAPDNGTSGSTGSAQASGGSTQVTWGAGLVGVLLALAVPWTIREARRRRLLAAARNGDAASAWASVQDIALDLGIPVPASESPRAFGGRLVTSHGAPAEAMNALTSAIERASYAADARHSFWVGDSMADAATAVRAALLRETSAPKRLIARVVPRSLVVRPGSLYAGTVGTPRAG